MREFVQLLFCWVMDRIKTVLTILHYMIDQSAQALSTSYIMLSTS